MRKVMCLVWIWAAFSISSFLHAQSGKQKQDTIHKILADTGHSVKKAVIFSAVLPGLGQVYNRKYWKVPIIYVAIGGSLYFAFEQRQLYQQYKTAYVERLQGIPNEFDDRSDQWLLTNMETARRNRDLLFILSGLLYTMNIIDAAVDAHLFYFDVSDNLSIHFSPFIQTSKTNGVMAYWHTSIRF